MKGPALIVLLLAAPAPAPAANVCIHSMDIARTSVPDAQTILFHMKDHTVWRNTLMAPCPELKFRGFVYDATPSGEICGNQQTIHVLQTGAVCLLGPFTQVPERH
ncbi:MAG TPA: hypothetical protein VMH86_09215 [Rhizomicrobium sp.]|nr:hypothetical protein [Rhizomicrobium sp.]